MVAAVPRRHKDAPPEDQLYAPIEWRAEGEYEDVIYERGESIAKITINRPEVHNAFRPPTLAELRDAFTRARDDTEVAAIIFTGAGDEAFCSGGDQRIRGDDGYIGDDEVAKQGVGRLDVGDLHVQIRRLPKPVVAMVAGYAVGGGHILHLVCDLTIAGDNAVFGQTGPRVGSFDGGFGASLLERNVGVKKAKEIWFLSRLYEAQEALDMGLVNTVVPLGDLERETVAWCREMAALSPLSLRLLKSSFNATEDGLSGIQQLSHDATLLFYMTEEGQEGRNAYQQGRSRTSPSTRRGPSGPPGNVVPEPARLGRRQARTQEGRVPGYAADRGRSMAAIRGRWFRCKVSRGVTDLRIWLMAARPRTLPAAIAPVLVGTAAAIEKAGELPRVGAFIAALIGSIFIQIGTNLANDYSDAKRGADTVDRLGPVR